MSDLTRSLQLELGASLNRLEVWLLEDRAFGTPVAPEVADSTFVNWDPRYMRLIVRHLLNRSCRLGRSIELLARNDLAIEAQPTLRVAVENAIDLRYISTNPVTLATKWMLFEDVVRWKGLRQDRPEDRPDDFELIESEVSARLRLLDEHRPHKAGKPWKLSELAQDWDQSSVEHRYKAAQAQLGDSGQAWYDMYRLLCAYVHGGTETFREFTKARTDGQFVYSLTPPRSKAVFVSALMLLVLQETIDAAQRCGAPLDPRRTGPQFDTLGIGRDELVTAAASDFDVNSEDSASGARI